MKWRNGAKKDARFWFELENKDIQLFFDAKSIYFNQLFVNPLHKSIDSE